MNDYYVYEWIRLDTNEPFYVGKGKDNRWKDKTRGQNNHFNNIVKSISVAVNILHDNLDEETAYGLECYYIWLYRDEIGYEMCNINDGGEGNSICGEKNPKARAVICLNTNEIFETISCAVKQLGGNIACIYECCNSRCGYSGKSKDGEPLTWMFLEDYKKATKENIENKLNKAYKCDSRVVCITTGLIFENCRKAGLYYNIDKTGIRKCCSGEYSFAGKLEDGTLLIWKNFITYKKMTKIDIDTEIERVKNLNKGENHPLHGRHRPQETIEKCRKSNIGKKRSQEFKENRSGKNSMTAKSVICLTTGKIFYTIKDGGKYYNVDNSSIGKCCKGFKIRKGKKVKVESAGKLPDGTPLVWRKIRWNHDKKYRIKGVD